jgi:hypothetical protein
MNFKDLRNQFKTNIYYNHPNNFGKEGEDHININFTSTSKIGKIFDPSYVKVINYHHIGKFSSVLNLWHWLRSDDLDDAIRRMSGYNIRLYTEANSNGFNKKIPNFKAIIGLATWYKIKSYKHIVKEIKELDPNIKFLSYYVVKSSNLRVCTNYASLVVDIVNIIVKAIRENTQPDFSTLVDDKDNTGLLYLEGFLSSILPADKIEEMKKIEISDLHEEAEDPEIIPSAAEGTDLEVQPVAVEEESTSA